MQPFAQVQEDSNELEIEIYPIVALAQYWKITISWQGDLHNLESG